MKTTAQLLAALGLFSAATLTTFAETAYTNPVMASSTELVEGYNVLGITALNPIEATGAIDSVAGVDADGFTTLVVSDVPSDWQTNSFESPGGVVEFNFRDVPLYYVEITSGDLEGQILDVIATGADTDNTLTVGADLSGMQSTFADQTFTIRRKHTLNSVFGADNKFGLVSGPSYADSDLVYVINEGVFEKFYYQTNELFGNGWRQIGLGVQDAGDVCVDPDFGVIVYKIDDSNCDVTSVGDVKIGTARTVFEQGFNPISLKFPVVFTLGDSGLYASDGSVLKAGSDYNSADLVYVLQDGVFKKYYYQVNPVFGNGWRLIGEGLNDESDVVIGADTMIIVYKRDEGLVEWTMNQPFLD